MVWLVLAVHLLPDLHHCALSHPGGFAGFPRFPGPFTLSLSCWPSWLWRAGGWIQEERPTYFRPLLMEVMLPAFTESVGGTGSLFSWWGGGMFEAFFSPSWSGALVSGVERPCFSVGWCSFDWSFLISLFSRPCIGALPRVIGACWAVVASWTATGESLLIRWWSFIAPFHWVGFCCGSLECPAFWVLDTVICYVFCLVAGTTQKGNLLII